LFFGDGGVLSRLSIITPNKAQATVEELYKDVERRIIASPTGLCPVDMAASFLKMCHAQSCGKCVPCRIGLGALERLLDDVLDGNATLDTIDLIEKTAQSIYYSADCAIGYEAARMVLKGIEGFRDDFVEHITYGRCKHQITQPVPCVSQCPADVDIPGYISLVEEGRYADAVRLIRKDNPFVSACGLVCEHPCEAGCRRSMMDASINIRGIKRYAAEHAGEVPAPKPLPKTGKKVAVIGGGPAGISAAYYLTLMGHSVTLYEAKKKLGGMLRYGIPGYRLPRDILDKEIATLISVGIEVKLETKVGDKPSIADLKEKYDAIYIAIGAQTDKKLGIEGEDAKGVISAVEMLKKIGDDEMPDYKDKDILVIGGGNVAMDVARSSIRLGAKSVKIIYRRRMEDMTAQHDEIIGAIDEGCELLELQAPVRIEKKKDGSVAALWIKPQLIGAYKSGRPAPHPSQKPEERIACDNIIVAIGQNIESQNFEKFGIPVMRGVIKALSHAGFEDIPGVFAGGDCVTGPATVIKAIAGGKVAAANIDEYLGFHHELKVDVEIPAAKLDDRYPCGRVNMTERSASERRCDFNLMEHGMSEEEVKQEAHRCLRCDHFGYGIFKGGRVEKW
jgi:NADPH-dependent glutamate synthase beta subunit-like oxidoreductase